MMCMLVADVVYFYFFNLVGSCWLIFEGLWVTQL